MSTTNPVVKCTVEQCTHHMPGNQCGAAKISVYNNEATGTSQTSADTCCKSFHHRKTIGDMVGALHNANWGGVITAGMYDGKQITPNVECFVANCKFWETGNFCNAGSITVTGRNASKTDDTDCETYVPKS
ncbi:protein of unknown function DUF1540 [Thermosinus carboxydivorans Nor1]|uniref:DUF1540 domain-containing protein n=1 Tax=Thermosinus carboxydivorans Nor1 TaxID=401526 RepID=A1HRZ8_9FIRM|nr:DUF1540 domain-containing protein [Thermosinus carboxydivorans]EAX47220.1 protein of unknown function DUF1540 [Thermosinus carboxydivorans Nor1]